jgi:hypothetical protein
VSVFCVSTSANASVAQNAATPSASFVEILPLVSTRSRVRATWRSKSRSAKSFTAQPADRIRKVPSTNTSRTDAGGKPSAAIQSAHSVGQSSSSVPMGLSQRISFR